MKRILNQAGQPKHVIDLVDSIVETCAICRTWSKPLPTSVATLSVSTAFNEQVECDLLFYKKYIILHLICRCIRWHAAKVVASRHMEVLIQAIDDVWVSIHGPMKEFIIDGETAIAKGWESKEYFKRKGIKETIRAPGMHAHFIERRGELMRQALHRIDTQLAHEGITDIPIQQRVNETVFSGNALLSINNTTPYNGLYGRVPNVLPDLNSATPEEFGGMPGTVRHTSRLREIAVAQIIEGSARARIERALHTPTIPAAQQTYNSGDDVDFYRPPANKDLPGWSGPANITDMSEVTRGIIKVKHNGRELICSPKDLRPHLAYLCFLAAHHFGNNVDRAYSTIRKTIDQLAPGKILVLGHVCPKQTWIITRETSQFTTTWNATQHLASQLSDVEHLVAARYGKATAVLPPTSEYISSLIIVWPQQHPDNVFFQWMDPTSTFNFRQSYGHDYENLRWFQLLCADETIMSTTAPDRASEAVTADDAPGPGTDASPADVQVGQPLETITEGSNEDDNVSLIVYDTTDDDLVTHGKLALHYLLTDNESTRTDDISDDRGRPDYQVYPECLTTEHIIPDHLYHIRCANIRAGLHPETYLHDTNESADLYYGGETLKLVQGQVDEVLRQCAGTGLQDATGYVELPTWTESSVFEADRAENAEASIPARDCISAYIVQHFLANKKAVIERDTDLLTREELIKHASEVAAAILTELKTWLKYECFRRRLRKTARNIVDCKWVIKWKIELLPDGTTRRIIRARLTIRGFKDIDAADLTRYAGTSQRYSQRLLVSEAANRKWPIVSTDISKAFLQGVTYAELAKMTGEPLRDVCFYLPPSTVSALKQLPGYYDFDPATEVLHCNKPGTGSVDAPRAFHLKLSTVTRQQCLLCPTKTDGELLILHQQGKLIAVLAIHVDDLKITGEQATIDYIVGKLQEVFGALILQRHRFTNCGVRHIQNTTTMEITLDQIEYIAALKQLQHPSIKGAAATSIVPSDLFEQFMSLRGAVAYTLLTRTDVSVYVVYLQRQQAETTTYHHVKMLNMVVIRLQTHAERIHFGYLGHETCFLVLTDAAFKKEETTGHALKGTLILRRSVGPLSTCKVHLLDFLTKRVSNVTRSTFSAELFSLCDACDHAMLLRQIAHEFTHGPLSAAQARDLREGVIPSNVSIDLAIDAMSVYSAVTASHIKIPSEKSLLSHLQYVRELLDKRILSGLLWVDTRDMAADGMTKGSVDRRALVECMCGTYTLQHVPKRWQPLAPASATAAPIAAPQHVLYVNYLPDNFEFCPLRTELQLHNSNCEFRPIGAELLPTPVALVQPRSAWEALSDQDRATMPLSKEEFHEWDLWHQDVRAKLGKRWFAPKMVPKDSRAWRSTLEYVWEMAQALARGSKGAIRYSESELQEISLGIWQLGRNVRIGFDVILDKDRRARNHHEDLRIVWHGTGLESLIDIAEHGYYPSYGAGQKEIIKKYGSYFPVAYVSPNSSDGRGLTCACGYPQELWSDELNRHCGEKSLLDDGPPLRGIMQNHAFYSKRVWTRDNKHGNIQAAYVHRHVLPCRAFIYATTAFHPEQVKRMVVETLAVRMCAVPFCRPWAEHEPADPADAPDPSQLTGKKRRRADGSERAKEFRRRSRRGMEWQSALGIRFDREDGQALHAPAPAKPPSVPKTEEERRAANKLRLQKWRNNVAIRKVAAIQAEVQEELSDVESEIEALQSASQRGRTRTRGPPSEREASGPLRRPARAQSAPASSGGRSSEAREHMIATVDEQIAAQIERDAPLLRQHQREALEMLRRRVAPNAADFFEEVPMSEPHDFRLDTFIEADGTVTVQDRPPAVAREGGPRYRPLPSPSGGELDPAFKQELRDFGYGSDGEDLPPIKRRSTTNKQPPFKGSVKKCVPKRSLSQGSGAASSAPASLAEESAHYNEATKTPSPETDGEMKEESDSDPEADNGPHLAPLEVTDPRAVGSTVDPKEGPDGTCLSDKLVPQAVKSARDEAAYRAQKDCGAEAVKAEVPYEQSMTQAPSAPASTSSSSNTQPALTSTKCEVPTMHTQSATASCSGTIFRPQALAPKEKVKGEKFDHGDVE